MTHDHGHGHGHTHDHPHDHTHDENPHAGQGAVVLDIGGDVGALVVTMPRSLVGEEIEILAGGQALDEPRQHVAVVERPTPAGPVPSLVFPDLVEGPYRLVPKGTDDVHLSVTVRGGEVTMAEWPA